MPVVFVGVGLPLLRGLVRSAYICTAFWFQELMQLQWEINNKTAVFSLALLLKPSRWVVDMSVGTRALTFITKWMISAQEWYRLTDMMLKRVSSVWLWRATCKCSFMLVFKRVQAYRGFFFSLRSRLGFRLRWWGRLDGPIINRLRYWRWGCRFKEWYFLCHCCCKQKWLNAAQGKAYRGELQPNTTRVGRQGLMCLHCT